MILSPRAPASAPLEKSPEAYRTIREVADTMDLPQHVLRFWETRFPQIKPLKRAGGRRYYRPDDIERLRLVKRLLYDEGYTIRGVQKLFKAQAAHGSSGAPRDLFEPAPTAEPLDAARNLKSGAKRAEARPSAPEHDGEELRALRDALAKINEAGRILAQSRARSL